MTATIKRASEALCFAVGQLPRHRWSMFHVIQPTPQTPDVWVLSLSCRACDITTVAVVRPSAIGPYTSTLEPVPPCSLSLHLD